MLLRPRAAASAVLLSQRTRRALASTSSSFCAPPSAIAAPPPPPSPRQLPRLLACRAAASKNGGTGSNSSNRRASSGATSRGAAATMSAPPQANKASAAAPSSSPVIPPEESRSRALDLAAFCDAAWTPYHAVAESARRLRAAGFEHIRERDAWAGLVKPGGRYFFTRNASTLVAFAVGEKYRAGGPFWMVGAHTDSPCLKLKPVTRTAGSDAATGGARGSVQVNVETYGGGSWCTWFDRDLGLAGRVLVRKEGRGGGGEGEGGAGGELEQRLVRVDRPVLRIPMLAIHLQRGLNTEGFKPNMQTHLQPVLATQVKAQLLGAGGAGGGGGAASNGNSASASSSSPLAKHPPALVHLLCEALSAQEQNESDDVSAKPSSSSASFDPSRIVDFELHVCDVQPASLGGVYGEFVNSGRLDNLASCHASVEALIASCSSAIALRDETAVRAIALFDHEEVGSESAQGAGGPVMRDTITRLARALAGGGGGAKDDASGGNNNNNNDDDAAERALRGSFLVSADMAHALHPNYTDKHDGAHAPMFHGGLVIKHNASQRYATNAVSAALFREAGKIAGVPCQEFCVRNDMPCGSTIGPILAAGLGCRTVDVGMPQLAMHSIRETMAADDVALGFRHLKAFFEHFTALDASLDVDALPPPEIKGVMRDPSCGAGCG
jgi:aspartyl aminopeptidase